MGCRNYFVLRILSHSKHRTRAYHEVEGCHEQAKSDALHRQQSEVDAHMTRD